MTEVLFFDLVRVAIGNQIRLSRMPTADEWDKLYDMAHKHSLVGVCFAALQKLGADADEGFTRIGMSEILYLTWMGMAAMIQQRNHVLDELCIALQTQLSVKGIASRILKGQGVATLYDKNLRELRQSGDIDLWMLSTKEQVLAWAKKVGVIDNPGYLHVGCLIFDNPSMNLGKSIEIEIHYRPTYMRSLRHNKRIQQFCEKQKKYYGVRGDMVVPSWDFDVVYQLSHMYRHLFGSGIGLRQLMDYYFVLRNKEEKISSSQILDSFKNLGLDKFAGAVMYVMREVFGLDEQYMICVVDEKRGDMLLRQVMQTGNFGHQDEKQRKARGSTMGTMRYKLELWLELVRFYPEETLSAPLWNLIRKFDRRKT